MKNKSIKSVLMTFMVALSLGSYIFLNTTDTVPNTSTKIEKVELPTSEASALPNIQVTKKLVKLAKEFLPVSH